MKIYHGNNLRKPIVMQIGTCFCDSLLKLRQAALNDAVDEANHFLAAVFFIALHNHVHQPVGQMGV